MFFFAIFDAQKEWEEKYNALSRECETQKRKVERLRNVKYMEQAKQGMQSLGKDSDDERYDDIQPPNASDSPRSGRPSSVASFASLSHHAKSIVTNFSCTGEREFAEESKRRSQGNSRIKHSRIDGGGERSSPQSIRQSLRQRSPFRARR